jgi:hypothetical protein
VDERAFLEELADLQWAVHVILYASAKEQAALKKSAVAADAGVQRETRGVGSEVTAPPLEL